MSGAPFSLAEFFGVFAAYNQAVWPAPLLLSGGAAVAVGLALWQGGATRRWVAAFLALLWLWTGAAYHLLHFSRINPAAFLFGGLFVVQGLLFLWVGVWRGAITFGTRLDAYGVAGGLLLLYALFVYPLLGPATGHPYPATPTFGTPCPSVIFTFGLLLLARGRVPGWLLVIPFAWTVTGTSAVVLFGVRQDLGLAVAGVVGTGMILVRNRALSRTATPEPVASTVRR